jgi:uncharacterized protein YndB with AHSA1/START domain
MINLGISIDRQTVTLDCTLAGSVERAWFYLTQPEGLASWLTDGAIECRIEGNVRLRFPAGESPVRSASGGLVYGQVERCEPYRLISYTWMDVSRDVPKPHFGADVTRVTYALSARERDVTLKLTHYGIPGKMLSKIGAGWHAHLSKLMVRMRDEMLMQDTTPTMIPAFGLHEVMSPMEAQHA